MAAPPAGIMAMMPQFVAKFSGPQTTEMMMGTSEKEAPYPRPRSADERWNKLGVESVRKGSARLRKARHWRKADGINNTRREKVMRVDGGWLGLDAGAKRSEREPVKRRANVEVRAIIDTCVLAWPAGGLDTLK